MRIVVFGLTVSSSWGNGHATLWRGLFKGLHALGHKITFFERDVPYYARHRDLEKASTFDLVLYRQWQEVLPLAESTLRQADAAIVTSYCPEARHASNLMRDSKAACKIFYDLDTPVTLERIRRNEDVEYVPEFGLKPFDLVLSYTGGKALEELQLRLGARKVAPLYGSVDPEVHHPAQASQQFAADFSYLGTYSADRQAQLEELFLKPARGLSSNRFLIGGSLFPQDFPWAPNIYFIPHVAPPEHSAFYSSSRLTLNVTRGAMAQMGYCPSGRLFEAAACGVPIVSDKWTGLERFFEPGKEILLAQSSTDVMNALTLSPEQLQEIRDAARARVLTQHTSSHRSRELQNLLHSA